MTKKIISAAAIALVILALCATLYMLNKNPVQVADEPPAYTPADVLYILGQAEAKRVKSLVVENENGGFTIDVSNADAEKTDDIVYNIKGLEGYSEERMDVSSVVNNSSKLLATSLVSENAPDLSLYGLGKPAVTAKITYTDGSTDELNLGDSAPGGVGKYAKSIKSNNVYLVSNANVEKFYLRSFDFFPKIITEGDPEANDIRKATLSGSVRSEPIVIVEAEKNPLAVYMMASHEITQPVKVDLDADRGISVLRSVFGLTATEILDIASTDEKKEAYGLLEPYSVLSVESKEDQNGEKLRFTLSVSKPDASGLVNLMTDSGDLVYSIPAAELKWLESQVFDIMSKQVILPFIYDVSKVTVKIGNAATVFNLEGDDENFKAASGDKTLDNDSFRRFYQTLLSARYDSQLEEPMPENAPFVMSYTYEYKDGRKPDVVTFRQGPARKLYIELNGGDAFFMPSSYMDKVVEDIPKLLAGQPVNSYL